MAEERGLDDGWRQGAALGLEVLPVTEADQSVFGVDIRAFDIERGVQDSLSESR